MDDGVIRLVPAGDTEFAKDAAFGYKSSNLREVKLFNLSIWNGWPLIHTIKDSRFTCNFLDLNIVGGGENSRPHTSQQCNIYFYSTFKERWTRGCFWVSFQSAKGTEYCERKHDHTHARARAHTDTHKGRNTCTTNKLVEWLKWFVSFISLS